MTIQGSSERRPAPDSPKSLADIKTPAQTAWEALQAEMRDTSPRCDGDDRYILDNLSPVETTNMWGICRRCPLYDLCADYSQHVNAGFWAGQLITRRAKR